MEPVFLTILTILVCFHHQFDIVWERISAEDLSASGWLVGICVCVGGRGYLIATSCKMAHPVVGGTNWI